METIKEVYFEVSEKIGQLKGWGQIITPLVVETEGGPQKVNCANTKDINQTVTKCNAFKMPAAE